MHVCMMHTSMIPDPDVYDAENLVTNGQTDGQGDSRRRENHMVRKSKFSDVTQDNFHVQTIFSNNSPLHCIGIENCTGKNSTNMCQS